MREPGAAGVVEALVKKGAALDARDGLGRGPLHLAALAGNAQATRALLSAGADARRADARRGATPAHYAAAFARVDVVRLFAAADPEGVREARDALGRSPLHWSALSAHRAWAATGSLEVASALVAAGASPRARDRAGATPAHSAARLGADAFLDHLAALDSAAEARPRRLVDECDNRGVSALDIVAARRGLARVTARFCWDPAAWFGLEGLPALSLGLSLPRPRAARDPPKP